MRRKDGREGGKESSRTDGIKLLGEESSVVGARRRNGGKLEELEGDAVEGSRNDADVFRTRLEDGLVLLIEADSSIDEDQAINVVEGGVAVGGGDWRG